jgi:hypothetical protein
MLFSPRIKITALLVLLAGLMVITGTAVAVDEHVRMQRFSDTSVIQGTFSELERDEDGVEMSIDTLQLTPWSTYTVWWVVFNNPEYCVGPCDGTDLLPFGGDPLVDSSVLYADGGFAKSEGRVRFGGTLAEGYIPGLPGQILFGPGLLDAEGAEVHLVVRDHGPEQAGLLFDQTNTFMGGCIYDPVNDPPPPTWGTEGTFACEDVQLAIHLPG